MTADILDLNEKRLERIPPGQLAGELMRLPAKKRLELILDRPDAEAVVAAMNPNDFFYSVQELGPDDALPLLAIARTGQLDHLFDLEWWRKDTIEGAKALTWLERLARASDRKLLEWVYHVDFALIIALFKQWISTAIAPEDVDIVEARETLPPTTLDDLYFWESKYPQYDALITHMLTLIFEVNYSFFKELMNHVLYASDSEVDEQAYHFHKARLADQAIPDFYEALDIYKPVNPGDLPKKYILARAEEDLSAPSFALALLREGDLLARVLAKMNNPELVDSLQFELAALANKVVVADQLPTDSPMALRQGVEKTLAYVSLGLEIQSGGDERKAADIIGNTFLEYLFRLAQAEVAAIRGRMKKIVKSGWLAECPGGTKCLDREWYEAAENLLAKTPKILGHVSPGASGVVPREDFFRTQRDLARGSRIVDVVDAAGDLFRTLKVDLKALELSLWPEGQVRLVEDITLGVIILTAAARFLTAGAWVAAPLLVRDWPKIFPLIQPPAMDRAVMDWAYRTMPDADRRIPAEDYLISILRDYEFEMRPFSPENPPEPQLVKFLIFEKD